MREPKYGVPKAGSVRRSQRLLTLARGLDHKSKPEPEEVYGQLARERKETKRVSIWVILALQDGYRHSTRMPAKGDTAASTA